MSRRAFNSIQGFSVGENPSQDIILANGDITTVNFTANGVSNLGPIGNVKITGGDPGQTIITDGTGNLVFTSTSGNSAAVMPYYIPSDKSYIVPTNFQGLFTQPIEIDGELEIDGILVQVGTPINAINRQVLFNNNGEITGSAGFTFEQSSGNLEVPGNVIVTGNVLPTADIVYSLGSSTKRWKDLFLSGTTILLGGGTISSSGGEMVLTNSQGGTLSVAGNGSSTSTELVNGNTSITVQSSNIMVTVNAISNIAVFSSAGLSVTGIANVTGNAIVAGILTDNYYYANGLPLDVGGNPGGSNTQIQINNNGEFGASANFTFDTVSNTLTVLGNAAFTNASVGNTLSANYLVSNNGCVTISTGIISVSSNTAGIFSSSVTDINFGLAANIIMGSSSGQVTVQNNLAVTGNVTTQNTIIAPNIKVSDLYSSRAPVNVGTNTIIDSFNKTSYRSAKYTIKAGSDIGYQALEVLLIHDSINSIMTVYGSLSITGVDLISLTSIVNGANVELLATGLGANTIVNLMGTYVPD